MKNLYIDFDGVILDTITPIYKRLEENNIDSKDTFKVRSFLSDVDYNEIIKEAPVINDAVDKIRKLISLNKFNINILTHINSLKEGEVKTNYIRRRFKDITVILVPTNISKTKMIHTEGSILVDDYAGNLREWEKEGGIPVRFSLKLNAKGFHVINDLSKLQDLF